MDEYTKKLEEVWKLLEDRDRANEKLHQDREAKINIEHDSFKVILEEKKAEHLQKDNPRAVEGAQLALLDNEHRRTKALNGESERYEVEKRAIEDGRSDLNKMHEQHLNERIALDKELVETQAKREKLLEDAPTQNSDPAVRAAKWIQDVGPMAEKAILAAAHALTGESYPGLPREVYKTAAVKAELAIEDARTTGSDTVKYWIPKTSQEIDQLVLKSIEEDTKQAPAKLASEQAKELEFLKSEITRQLEREKPDKERSR